MFPRPAAPIFCSVSRVSEVTLGPFLVFFGYVLGTKLGVLLRMHHKAMQLVLGKPAAPIFCSVSRVSEVTLGTFLVGFSD